MLFGNMNRIRRLRIEQKMVWSSKLDKMLTRSSDSTKDGLVMYHVK